MEKLQESAVQVVMDTLKITICVFGMRAAYGGIIKVWFRYPMVVVKIAFDKKVVRGEQLFCLKRTVK